MRPRLAGAARQASPGGRARIPRVRTRLVAAALGAGCGAEATPKPPFASPARGGTLRVVVPRDTFNDGLRDPHPTWLDPHLGRWFTWGPVRGVLVRTPY